VATKESGRSTPLRGDGTLFFVPRPDGHEVEPSHRDLADRARVKAALRAHDEEALASGEKSAQDLRRENAHFAGLNVRLDFSRVRSLT
jgi:hypothetical protein